MRLVSSRTLARHTHELLVLAGGEVVALSFGRDGSFCEAYDAELRPLWSLSLAEPARACSVDADEVLWVCDTRGALAISKRGVVTGRVDAQLSSGMRVSAFSRISDGFIFAGERDLDSVGCSAVLQRLDSRGRLLWSTDLPIDAIAFEGVIEMRAADAWRPRAVPAWTPETWLSTSARLAVSDQLVLGCFSEMPRSGIGLGYAVSLDDGGLCFTTKKGPIQTFAALEKGAFLVGYQGYGAFETLRYEYDGRVTDSWASHGHYVVEPSGVRVIELENVLPSKMHLSRLLPGGEIARGDRLDGYATSRPFVRSDGALIFFQNGELLVAADLSIDERLTLCEAEAAVCGEALAGNEHCAYVGYVEGAKGSSTRRLGRVLF